MMRKTMRVALAVGCSLAALISAARAQDSTTANPDAATDIIVLGSRIPRV